MGTKEMQPTLKGKKNRVIIEEGDTPSQEPQDQIGDVPSIPQRTRNKIVDVIIKRKSLKKKTTTLSILETILEGVEDEREDEMDDEPLKKKTQLIRVIEEQRRRSLTQTPLATHNQTIHIDDVID